MNWKMFWEQYFVSIDLKPGLSDPEKLAYLCQALKDGQAKDVIEGLSGLGDDYKDTVEYLHGRYDKPYLIHCKRIGGPIYCLSFLHILYMVLLD